ncbi:MAG: hypothetical protein EXR07_21815 [Acetobacteraceae bacterium]|nr:hypothetical protein [Acetobacteraceae bacterium]
MDARFNAFPGLDQAANRLETLPQAGLDKNNADEIHDTTEGETMPRATTIAAIAGMTASIGISAARAQTRTPGVLRESVSNTPYSQLNCWTQAMVSGGRRAL